MSHFAELVQQHMIAWDRPTRQQAQATLDALFGKAFYHRLTDSEWEEIEQFYETQRLKRTHLYLPLYAIRKAATRPRRYQAFVIVNEPTFMEIRILLVDGLPGDYERSYTTTMSGASIHSKSFTDEQRQTFIQDQQQRAARLSETN